MERGARMGGAIMSRGAIMGRGTIMRELEWEELPWGGSFHMVGSYHGEGSYHEGATKELSWGGDDNG